jgi:hypothetical protein
MTHLPKLSESQRAALQQEEEAPMSPADFVARCNAPWTDVEREDFYALVDWFTRRYPTAGERLAATRHLMAQWALPRE